MLNDWIAYRLTDIILHVRYGKRTIQGIVQDGWNALARYYLNNFADGTKQVCDYSYIIPLFISFFVSPLFCDLSSCRTLFVLFKFADKACGAYFIKYFLVCFVLILSCASVKLCGGDASLVLPSLLLWRMWGKKNWV